MSDVAPLRAASQALMAFSISVEEAENLVWKRAPSRWAGEVDFGLPSPPKFRPTIDGRRAFHFAWTPISKATWPEISGVLIGGKDGSLGKAPRFESYLGRPGAAELLSGEPDSEKYLLREGGPEEGLDARQPSDEGDLAISNIAAARDHRESFWRQAEEHERKPRHIQIQLHPECGKYFDQNLDPDIPAAVRSHIKSEWEKYRDRDLSSSARRHRSEPLSVTKRVAGLLLLDVINRRMAGDRPVRLFYPTLEAVGGKNPASPITFHTTGGGRIQYRVEAELPHALPRKARRTIAALFGRLLARWKLRFTIVVHKPDAHGDPRNKHLHAIIYDRKCRYIAEFGKWDFAIRDESSGGRGKNCYPYRQGKVLAVGQRPEKVAEYPNERKLPPGCTDFVDYLRKRYARLVNAVLAQHGISERYDPRSYEKMGIGFTPTSHWGQGAAALEKAGVPTKKVVTEAVLRWHELEEEEENKRLAAKARDRQAERDVVAFVESDAERPNGQALLDLAARRTKLAAARADVAYEYAIMKLRRKRARSRAATVLHAETWAKPADLVKAGPRFEAARRHIEAIDLAIEPYRPAVAAILRKDRERRVELAEVERQIQLAKADPAYAPPAQAGGLPVKQAVTQAAAPPAAAKNSLVGTSARGPSSAAVPAPARASTAATPGSKPAAPPPAPADPLDDALRRVETDGSWVRRTAAGLVFDKATLRSSLEPTFADPAMLKRAQPRMEALYNIQEALAQALRTSPSIRFGPMGILPESVPEGLRKDLERRNDYSVLKSVARERAEELGSGALAALAAEIASKAIRVKHGADPRMPRSFGVDHERLSREGRATLYNYALDQAVQRELGEIYELQTAEIENLVSAIGTDTNVLGSDGRPRAAWLAANSKASGWLGETEITVALAERQQADRKQAEEREIASIAKAAAEQAERDAQAAAERKVEAERIAKAEADRLARGEAERLAKAEAERLAKVEADRLAKVEADRLAKAEADRLAKVESDRIAKAEAERLAKVEAERTAKVEADRLAKADAQRIATTEAEQRRSRVAEAHEGSGRTAQEIDAALKILADKGKALKIVFRPEGPDLTGLAADDAELIRRHLLSEPVAERLTKLREEEDAFLRLAGGFQPGKKGVGE